VTLTKIAGGVSRRQRLASRRVTTVRQSPKPVAVASSLALLAGWALHASRCGVCSHYHSNREVLAWARLVDPLVGHTVPAIPI
jgi:hypothetical protein